MSIDQKNNQIDFSGFKSEEIEIFFKEVFGLKKEPSVMAANIINKSQKKVYSNDDLVKIFTKAYMVRDINNEKI